MKTQILKDLSLEQLAEIRAEFPILEQRINDKPLVYLDNGATTQKPLSVINAVSDHYKNINSNIHRGVHTLSQRATDRMSRQEKKSEHT